MEQGPLFQGHFPGLLLGLLVFVSQKVKNTVGQEQGNHPPFAETETSGLALGRLYGNDQVTQKTGVEPGELSFLHGEGDDIGGFVPAEVAPIQVLNLGISDEEDAEFSVRNRQLR